MIARHHARLIDIAATRPSLYLLPYSDAHLPMSQLQLNKISKDIIDHAEQALVPEKGLNKVVDDYFVQHVKEDEILHADVDARLYESLRATVKTEVLPLYEQYRAETARVRERKQKRKLWQYMLGTMVVFELLQAILTRGRTLAPQVMVPSAILTSFIGAIIYTAAQYIDDIQIGRSRKRLERAIEGLDRKAQTDVDYEQRRQLLDADVPRAEAMEICTHYDDPQEFWRDFRRVREMDPTVPSEVRALNLPAFEKFLRYHVEGQRSEVARQHRFNRLFIEAHEIFVSRDRANYVLNQLKQNKVKS